jgi:hypothetical protein
MPACERARRCQSCPVRGRAGLIGTVATMAVLWGLETGLPAQTPTPVEKTPAQAAGIEKKAIPDLEPFDLAYVPVEASSLIAVRPAAIFRRADMKGYGESVQTLIRLLLADFGLSLPTPIALESIEQVTFALTRPHRSNGNDAQADRDDRFCLSVRCAEGIDWRGAVKHWSDDSANMDAAWVKVVFEGKTYRKLPEPDAQAGKAPAATMCVFVPDARTVVVADETSLRAVIKRPAREVPKPARGRGWQAVCRGLIAFATTQDGPDDKLDDVSSLVMEFFLDVLPLGAQYSRQVLGGIDRDETLRIRISDDLDGAKEASAAALESIGKLAATRLMLGLGSSGAEAEMDGAAKFMFGCAMDLLKNCQIRANGPAVEIDATCKARLADLAKAFGSDLRIAPEKDDKPATAKSPKDTSRSTPRPQD